MQAQDYTELCSSKPFFQFSRIYFLELMSHYYERFHEDILGFDKDIIFICAGVVHPKAIEYLKDRNLVITQKVLAFPYYINLKDFSYAAVGFSVAHTLSYLATYRI